MTHVEAHFVKPLADFYGRNPFGPGFASRLEPFAKTLSDEVLQTVATKLIEKGGKGFPSFTQCRDALSRAETFMAAPTSTEPKPWDYKSQESTEWEAKKRAFALCRCSMGETADSEGWLVALLDFCRERGRLPNAHEVGGVKAIARRSEEALEAARGSPLFRTLVELRQAMKDSAHREVFGFAERQTAA